MHRHCWSVALLISPLLLLAASMPPAHAAGNGPSARTFPQTGHTVQGRFLQYWDAQGGLARFGYPLTEAAPARSPLDGHTYTVQYFERAVFEAHPENPPPFDVLLGQLGRGAQVIRQAKQAAAALPSPPRVYRTGKETALWPDAAGTTTTTYSTCGIVPAPAGGAANACEGTMTLRTQVARTGADWTVTFSAAWAGNTLRHAWVLSVAPDGSVTPLQESGDPLPFLPQ